MRMILVMALALAAGWAVAPQAGAQTPPPGSWSQTCSNIRWDGPILIADCLDVNGAPAYTRYDTRGSSLPVQNCNGDLVRTDNCASAQSMRAPGGPWRRHPCDFGRIQGSMMIVYCFDERYYPREIRVDLNRMVGPLDICQGALATIPFCAPYNQPAANALPPGNWADACQDARVENGVLYARCWRSGGWEQRNGRYVWREGVWGEHQLNIRNHDGPVSYCDGVISRLPSC